MPKYFTHESVHLLASLRKNNNREWYALNKNRLEDFIFAPARQLVVDVGKILRSQAEGLVADPRVDRSIYRLHRDTRFSNDKKPYKEHLGLIWWQDFPEGKLASPCFYFQLMPDGFMWSVGCYRFTPATLLAFRRTILDPEYGRTFKLIASGARRRDLQFNPPDLKRLPAGFTGPDWALEWLKRKSVYTWSGVYPNADNTILGPQAARYLAKMFLDGMPVYLWLVKLFDTARALEPGNQETRFNRAAGPRAKKIALHEDDF
ncbi:MAG: DUF2461 domain-containing protein [Deltaproteobacteria bacterium]|nr:DUF2461 domain-containing protein [Deltaproteobacteria bacterium]